MKDKYMRAEDTRRFNSFLVAAGYNIGQLAEEIGMSRATLSSRINGKTDFARSEMEKIAAILGRRPEEIFLQHSYVKRNRRNRK